MFGLGPFLSFLIGTSIPARGMSRGEVMSVIYTNLALIGWLGLITLAFGWQALLLIQLPVLWLAGAAGIWLFYENPQLQAAPTLDLAKGFKSIFLGLYDEQAKKMVPL
jgi:omega-6 fatty acid desaturase (delta-12 desaturase)